jgi:uncharacterized membrane protein YbhN (UPF0104 family)
MTMLHLSRRWCLYYLVALIVLVLGSLAAGHWGLWAQALRALATLQRLSLQAIILALISDLTAVTLLGLMWQRLIRQFGVEVSGVTALGIYLSTGLAGAVGTIAGTALGAILLLRRHGLAAGPAAVFVLIANALGFCGILVWTPLGWYLLRQARMRVPLPILGYHDASAVAVLLVGLAAGIILFLYLVLGTGGGENPLLQLPRHLFRRPRFHESRLARLGGKLFGTGLHGTGDTKVKPRVSHVLSLIPYSAGAWLAGVIALWVILANVSGTMPSLMTVLGSVALASALGSLFIVIPSGLGVTDSALVLLLVHSTGISGTTCVFADGAMRVMDFATRGSTLLLIIIARLIAKRRHRGSGNAVDLPG